MIVIAQRRRTLLQENGGIQTREIKYIDLNSTEFHKESIAENAELLDTFRFSIRLRIDVSGVTTTGRIISNDNIDNSTGWDYVDNVETGTSLVVELLPDNNIELSLCGFRFQTDRLEEGVWHEFGVAVTKQSFVTFIHNSKSVRSDINVVTSYRFDKSSTGTCRLSNEVITIGRNNNITSATGVQIHYVLINSNIRTISESYMIDIVFETGSTDIIWTNTSIQALRYTLAYHLQSMYLKNPVNTYVEQVDSNIMLFVRIHSQIPKSELIDQEIENLLRIINTDLDHTNLPPISLKAGNGIDTRVIPLLGIRYDRKRPLYCDIFGKGKNVFTQSCIFDGLQLAPHSVTFNDHQIDIQYISAEVPMTTAITSDFATKSKFVLRAQDIQIPTPKLAKDNFVRHWGGGQDSEIQFFVRTGPDTGARMIDFTMDMPYTKRFPLKVTIDYHQSTGVVLKMYVAVDYPIISTNLAITPSFQHVRIVWRATSSTPTIEIWVDAEIKASVTDRHYFPGKGDVKIESTILNFFDTFREITNIHMASITADACKCSSQCEMGYYGADCTQCPNRTRTYQNQSVDINQCLCIVGYHREDPSKPDSCVQDEITDFTYYNITQSLLKGHCLPQRDNGVDTEYCARKTERDGCSCQDDCVFATGDEKPCCRNKCAVCPNNNDENEDPSKRQEICDCRWDETSRRAYNAVRPDDDWDGLCSAAFCDIGEKRENGLCIPCPIYHFKKTIDPLPSCTPCPTCNLPGHFRDGCFGGNDGNCEECTQCTLGMVESTPCSAQHDRTCVNMSTCEGIGKFLRENGTCADGTYHAGCDPLIGEMGWCESCPIQDATECEQGFFLNFECTKNTKLSLVPNECLPCNHFKCKTRATFPSASDCGDTNELHTMRAETIKCSQNCSNSIGDVWIKRECQYFIIEQDPMEGEITDAMVEAYMLSGSSDVANSRNVTNVTITDGNELF